MLWTSIIYEDFNFLVDVILKIRFLENKFLDHLILNFE